MTCRACQFVQYFHEIEAIQDTYSESQSITKSHQASKNSTCLPRPSHGYALLSLWPEQIKEECCSKDCSNVDANEDVVGSNADKVVIVYSGVGVDGLDIVLLTNVIYRWISQKMLLSCG